MFDLENPKSQAKDKKKYRVFSIDGIVFESRLEVQVYAALKFRQVHGMLSELTHHRSGAWIMSVDGKEKLTKFQFTYKDGAGKLVLAKVSKNAGKWFLLKKVLAGTTDCRIELYRGNKRGCYLADSIAPFKLEVVGGSNATP